MNKQRMLNAIPAISGTTGRGNPDTPLENEILEDPGLDTLVVPKLRIGLLVIRR